MFCYRSRTNALFCFLLLMFCASLASAQSAISRPDLLQQMDGQWTMSGDVLGQPVTYSLEVKPVLSGTFTQLQMQDVQVPPEYAAHVYIGYDETSKTLIVHWMDNSGARHSIPHATGTLNGNTLQFTFPYKGGNFRDTFTFDPAAKQWRFVLESQQSDGTWKHFAKYRVVRRTPG